MKAAAYLRVSTEEQRERKTIETQRGIIRQYAEREGIELAGEYVDDGVSGTIPFHQRPGGAKLLADKPERVIVYRLDRIGRDTIVTLSALRHLREQGIRVESTSEDLNDVLLTEIKAAIGADELRTIRKRSQAGMKRKAKEGGWLGGPVPYGYRVEGNRGDATLRPCEAEVVPGWTEAGIVRQMFSMAADGKSCPDIAAYLNALGTSPGMRPKDGSMRGIRTKGKASRWLSGRVNRILRATIYKGQHTFNFKSETVEREFPALVEPHIWEAAQATMKGNRWAGRHARKRRYLLRGKIVCEGCATTYVGQTFTDNRGRTRSYYSKAHAAQRNPEYRDCPHRVIRVDEIEEDVWNRIRDIIGNPESVLEDVRNSLGGNIESRAALSEEIAEYRQRLKAKGQERDRVVTAFRKGLLDEGQLERQQAELQAEEESLISYIHDLEGRIMDDEEAANRTRAVAKVLEQYRGIIGRGKLRWEDRRGIVDALLERINVRTWIDDDGEKHQTLRAVLKLEAPAETPLEEVPHSRTGYVHFIKQELGA